ncbi:hypothetical protein FF098_003710 [Parvularcula flava]|uniref:Uncharacterized protein n=1 Tax=Aquisalinus luteolus TaxID=1566827 RepID=A0A8J3EQ61_9PROT|nr:hypothetical protein [Aquisalinus luteolus]NHK27009.1 hypothetical protein [Aquisalinus luteolus]GGH94088.1 hypothetical protein GCM10011355_07450 [Aquisalinus luteolus]
MKTTPLSVRVNDDDAAFLARLEIGNARTPSEKLRALLEAERQRQEGLGDRIQAAEAFHDLLRQSRRQVRQLEGEADLRSDFMLKVTERLPELAGTVFAGPSGAEKGGAGKGTGKASADPETVLKAFEAQLLDEVFALIRETLEAGLTRENRCYDPQGVSKRLGPVLELVELVNMSLEKRKGDK